jgi:serine/threonine-protein kinase
MMAKKPEDRYQSAREIVRDINRLSEALNLGTVAAISISSPLIGVSSEALRGSATQPWTETPPQSSWLWRIGMVGSVLLALTGGLVFGWVQHQRQQPAKDSQPAPVVAQPEDKKATAKDREKELQQRVQEHLEPENPLDQNAGLKACVDLGLFYLKLRRLDDAEKHFRDISKPERKVAYQYLGRLGQAMVLAFRNESAASNQKFIEIIGYIEKNNLLWKENPSMREMVAKALNHNFANDPGAFAEKQPAKKLNVYRFPPRPTLKAPPP